MTGHLAEEYFLVVFVASGGVLQLIAARNSFKGLLFFNRVKLTYALAILAVGGAFGWFFGCDNRLETEITRTGLEGAQQFLYFTSAAFSSLIFTLIVTSLIRGVSVRYPNKCKQPGLDMLREMSYIEAIEQSFGIRLKKREDSKSGDSG